MIKKSAWIEVEEIVLTPKDRVSNIPDETKKNPLKCQIRGKCLSDCQLGNGVEVETNIWRIAKGKVVELEPGYYHNYGKYVEEISNIGRQAIELIAKQVII